MALHVNLTHANILLGSESTS